MATNKRFLGLGFTFTATDKGLEKKLQGVNSALKGISESLTQINNQAGSAGASMGKMKGSGVKGKSSPKVSEMSTVSMGMENLAKTFQKGTKKEGQAKKNTFYEDQFERFMKDMGQELQKPQSGMYQDLFDKVSKDAKKMVTDVQKVLGPEVGKRFVQAIQRTKVELDAAGDFSADTRKKLHRLSEGFLEGSEQMGKYLKEFTLAKKSFEFLKGWFGDIGNSVERFLSSVGVDLSTIVPEQFKALFGIAKSVTAPLVKGLSSIPKMILGNIFKKEQGEVQSKMLESLRGIFNVASRNGEKELATLTDISDKLGSRPSGTKNVNNFLEEISKNTIPQKKGFMDKVKDFFGGFGAKLASIVPGLGLLARLLAPVASGLAAVLAVSALAAMAGKFLSGFGETIKDNWKVFQEFGAAVSRLGSALIKQFPILGQLTTFFKQVGQDLLSFGKSLINVAAGIYEKLPDGFKMIISGIGDVIRDLVDALVTMVTHPLDFVKQSLQGWESFGKILGGVATDAAHWSTDFLNKQSDKLENKSVTPAPAPKPAREDLSKMIGDQTDSHTKLLSQQLQATQNQTGVLAQLLREFQTQKDRPVNAQIKIKNSSDAQVNALSMGM